jgi:hypothetical protein
MAQCVKEAFQLGNGLAEPDLDGSQGPSGLSRPIVNDELVP